MKRIGITLVILLGMLTSCGGEIAKPLPVVSKVDINRYAGKWFEVAKLPNRFEKGLKCITATYTLKANGKIEVLNAGHKIDNPNEVSNAKGVAWIPDKDFPGKLKVRFFWPFSGNYWILALDEQYQWALVGDDSRKYLWILARTPELDKSIVEMLLKQAADQGFDTSKVEFTQHDCRP